MLQSLIGEVKKEPWVLHVEVIHTSHPRLSQSGRESGRLTAKVSSWLSCSLSRLRLQLFLDAKA
jgi:hypothetical protein